MITSIILLALFFFLLAIGTPIFLVLGVTTLILYLVEGTPIIGIASLMLDNLNSPILMAIPFFVIAASFMQRGGIAKASSEGAAGAGADDCALYRVQPGLSGPHIRDEAVDLPGQSARRERDRVGL